MAAAEHPVLETHDLTIRFGGHVAVSVTALLLGLAISLPLAFASMRRPALQNALLGVASVVQTIPSLALLALFYPLLLGLAALCERLFGTSFSALGFLPSVLALALYSMLPVLRNTLTGLLGVDPALKEAAAGVGMTARQSLFKVELPLALPVIMAGIRTAAVWVIGTATLSTPIGQTSLGNYIFTGLQTQNWVFVLFGCLAAAALALAVDQLLALIESGFRNRSRWRSALGGIAYGSRGWHFPLARQFAVALALTAVGHAVLALRWEPWALAAWCLFAGVAIAPALIIQSMLVTKSAPAEQATEAFTWTTSALLAGVGIGLPLGGALLEKFPPAAALAAGAAVSLAAGAAARWVLGR